MENIKSTKKKRKSFSPKEKLEILTEFDAIKSIKAIAEKYSVNARTIRKWKAERAELEKLQNTDLCEKLKLRKSPFDQLNEAIYIWYRRTLNDGINLSGPLIMAKALELKEEMKINVPFVASEGWLSRWKMKYGIQQYTGCSKKLPPDVTRANNFKEQFSSKIQEEQLNLCQIFNADETGLNFKMMPKKTLTEKKNRPTGFKQNKERVTIIVCSNADGSLKLPLVIIGKSEKPKAIKNISRSTLPVYYAHQKNAWTNAAIFERWFKDDFVPRVKQFLHEKGLPIKAVLLVDNARCHSSAESLSIDQIKIICLSPNTTSLIQPMNQGIIENLKRKYRSLFLNSLLYAQKNGTNVATQLKVITIKDVIYWVADAYNSIEAKTIFNCWKQILPARFFDTLTVNSEQSVTDNNLLNNLRQIDDYKNASEENVQDWIMNNDEDLLEVPSSAKIIKLVTSDEQEIEDCDDASSVEKKINLNDIVSAANLIHSFYEQTNLLSQLDLAVIRKAKESAIKLAILN